MGLVEPSDERDRGLERAISTFVIPRVAARMLQLVESRTAKSHLKLVQMLAHFDGFDQRFVVPYRSNEYWQVLAHELDRRCIGHVAYVVSEFDQIDGRVAALSEIAAIDGTGVATFAVFGDGDVAFYQGETAATTTILTQALS